MKTFHQVIISSIRAVRHKNIGNDISEKSSSKSSKSKSYIFISFLLVFALAFIVSKTYDNIKV